ncbi:MAG TPA: hypothetical protein PKM73_14295 [Verrucomicrobiota bacterium]|nr:hypothetical protein [Verrucomicrobiota bacterium]HNU51722.1 hypothetical protein [Verrucomicrobiota bacterium]
MEPRKTFLLRINAELWRELEAWAQDELRSVNGQVEYVLRQALQRRRAGGAEEGEGAGSSRARPGGSWENAKP